MLLHFATRTNDYIFRWVNQKHLKNPNCKLCHKKEDIIHLYISCKRNKRIWEHFQKCYQKLTRKNYTPLEHIITHSASSLPSKTKKLLLTITSTILTHIWKTRNRLQFDNTVIPTTNTIINIKNDEHTTNNTIHRIHYMNLRRIFA